MEAKIHEMIIFLAISLILQLCMHQAAAALPSSRHQCSSSSPVQKKLISVSESEWSALQCECVKTEGQCLLELISKLNQVEEEIALAVTTSLGLCSAKPPDSVKLDDSVRQWEQDVARLEYRLSELMQKLVSAESNNEKLVTTFSYVPDLVAMVDHVSNNVSEAVAAITCLGHITDTYSTVYDNSLIANLENFVVEVALAVSIVERTSRLVSAKNSIFREVDKLKRISDSLDAAKKYPIRSLDIHKQTTELVSGLNDQVFQLRRATDLLKSTFKDSSTSVVVEHLQRMVNLVNHEEQQIAWLIHLIGIARHSLIAAQSSLTNIPEHMQTVSAGNLLSALAVQITKFESYRNSLLQSQALTPQVIDHTINLLTQLEFLQQIVRQHTIPEVTEPLSRLDEISNAVRRVQRIIDNNIILHSPLALLQTDLSVLTEFNSQLLQNIPLAQDIKLQNGAHLLQYGDYILVTLNTLSLLARNIQSEVEDKNIELHQQVYRLSTSAMLVNEGVNTYWERTRNIKLFSAHLVSRLQETPQIASDTERVLETLPSQFSLIEQQNAMGNKVIDGANVSLNDAFAQIHLTRTTVELAEGIMNRLWNLLDQVSLPVQFSNDTVLTFDPKGNLPTYLTAAIWEFQSVSFSMRKTEFGDCTIIQLSETWQLMGHNISMVVGVINGSITASFEFSHPLVGIESISLIIDERNITLYEEFLVEVSRTNQNVHLFLHDLKNERMYCSSGAISSMLSSFFRGRSARRIVISLGGATSVIQQWNSPFMKAGNFSGCLSGILLNGENMNLWSLASSIQANFQPLQPCSSPEVMLSRLKISCNGREYAQATILQGKLLPLEFSFNTFHRNGILLYASDRDMARFIQVSLISGHVVTTISSDREQTTLISNRTYTNGTNQFFSLSLLSSQDVHMLILQTPLEETSVKMDLTETESLLNFTDVFVCGVPYNLVNTSREISNFTGCATLSSGVTLDPLPLNCSFDHQVRPCSHCLNEAIYAASFYGTSYALFAPITVKTYFDVRFSFVTLFPNGLLLHSGDARRRRWFGVVIADGRLELLFGSPFGALSLSARTQPLNDLMRHTVTIEVNTGSTIDILIDGDNVGNFPFGSFFPVGTLTPVLSVGGIAPSMQELILSGVTTEGFKGCIDHLHVLGQPLDFSGSEEAAQINFKIGNESQMADAFLFDGNGYARYDLGRFDPDFNLGLQLRTASSDALLLYMEDVFALQIVNGEVGIIIANDKTGSSIAISSNMNISDRIWHSVVVIKSGSHVQLLVDNQVTTETNAAPAQIASSSSDLLIGGTSSNGTLALPQVTEKRFKGEMRMAYLEHSIQSVGIQHTIQTT